MEQKENLFPVFNKSIADQLIMKGFGLVNILPNKQFPQYSVFYFEKTHKFDITFYELQVKNKSKRENAD